MAEGSSGSSGGSSLRKPIWWVAGLVIAAAAVALFLSWRANRAPPVAIHAPAASPAPPAEPAVQNPVPAAGGAAQPLPPLNASDASVDEALGQLVGKPSADSLFRPNMIVRHVVVTVDNLSRKKAAVELRPTKPVAGAFLAAGNDEHATIDPANYQRYAPYVQTLQALDSKQLAALYFHYYPLFQQAYQDLGYPNGYFNDRLIETVDNLLATPDVKGDVALVRPNVMYQYADPALESLSAGQKLMLRMGPANEAVVKAKLRELRAVLAERTRGNGARVRDGDGATAR
jgi:Protein of unknown function (DUF3014)